MTTYILLRHGKANGLSGELTGMGIEQIVLLGGRILRGGWVRGNVLIAHGLVERVVFSAQILNSTLGNIGHIFRSPIVGDAMGVTSPNAAGIYSYFHRQIEPSYETIIIVTNAPLYILLHAYIMSHVLRVDYDPLNPQQGQAIGIRFQTKTAVLI